LAIVVVVGVSITVLRRRRKPDAGRAAVAPDANPGIAGR